MAPIDHSNMSEFLDDRLTYLLGLDRRRGIDVVVAAERFVPGTRCEFDVIGVGREEKAPPAPPQDPSTWRMQFEDLIAGAFTYRIPLYYRLSTGGGRGLNVTLGTWLPDADRDADCLRAAELLQGLLGVLYPTVSTTNPRGTTATAARDQLKHGLVLGHPTLKPPAAGDNTLPVDRLIRALGDRLWSITVVAAPERESVPSGLRKALIAELTTAQTYQHSTKYDQPVVKQFTELVEPVLADLLRAAGIGSWRAAVYLSASPHVFELLTSVWRALYSGVASKPEAIRVVELPADSALADDWAFPLGGGDGKDDRLYEHPYQFQTLLNSSQLAAYVHLPSVEVAGFRVDAAPRFDVSPRELEASEPALILGGTKALPGGGRRSGAGQDDPATRGRGSTPPLALPVRSLARHAFIAGVTGSGKTTTTLHLLRGLHRHGVPFLVIEPAKREYRDLSASHMLGGDSDGAVSGLLVHSASPFEDLPLRINPFEVEIGTSVTEHIDLLRSVFAASFGDMWTPLPQVLEQCMIRVYEDRGWDLAADRNSRLAEGEDRSLAFPTMTEMANVVGEIVDRLGFDPEARDRIKGSLATRIDGLRLGSKGVLFDTRRPLDMSALLSAPSVLELERLADGSDKAFMMGLLLVRLVEFRRREHRQSARPGHGLRHVLVIEEAHRLLSAGNDETAIDNMSRAKAVETFSDLLAEVRAYGQGIIVIDQAPDKLVPDVLKNTNLKIAHRTVAESDRRALAGSMAMNDSQMTGLTILAPGEAAVFGDGDDAPVLVQVDPSGDAARGVEPTVRATVASPDGVDSRSRAVSSHWQCARDPEDENATECRRAERLAARDDIRQAVVRVAARALEADRVAALNGIDLLQSVQRDSRPGERTWLTAGCLAALCAEWLAERWGASRGWTFTRTHQFAARFRDVLVAAITGTEKAFDAPASDVLIEYRRLAGELLAREHDPFPACAEICKDDRARLCLYRSAVEMTWARTDMQEAWDDARQNEAADAEGYPRVWATCADTVAPEILGPQADMAPSHVAALCFAQHAIAAESPGWPPWDQQTLVLHLIDHRDDELLGQSDLVTGSDDPDSHSPEVEVGQ